MQYAVLEAFDGAKNYPEEMAIEFKARRDLICTRLNAMEGVSCHVPEGAFYVFPKVEIEGLNSEEIAIELLKGGVLCSPGSAFGDSGEGHLRFAYTISREDISRGMDKVETVLKNLRA
jgi:aspartate/methionine/tyrosine aminotransferase